MASERFSERRRSRHAPSAPSSSAWTPTGRCPGSSLLDAIRPFWGGAHRDSQRLRSGDRSNNSVPAAPRLSGPPLLQRSVERVDHIDIHRRPFRVVDVVQRVHAREAHLAGVPDGVQIEGVVWQVPVTVRAHALDRDVDVLHARAHIEAVIGLIGAGLERGDRQVGEDRLRGPSSADADLAARRD
jgi:hypothetical protein